MIDAPWLRELNSKADIVSVCPEVEIGLGVPRTPINLVKYEKGIKVVQDTTGIDLSEEMVSFSQGYLRFIGDVDAFVLKNKSPSCGLRTTKIYEGESYTLGSGIFAGLAKELFPKAVIVDEGFMDEKGVDALLDLINQR